jgi:predicted phage terminase large subunit-like protein
MQWSVVYKSAENPDGSLLFPERLTKEFLREQKRIMGSYLYANQYLNQVIPDDERVFHPTWWREDATVPQGPVHHFGFIDPAIGQNNHNDYTGIVVVTVDAAANWYVRLAKRARFTPTQIVDAMFAITETFKLSALGVEIVAYQEALLYILDEKMRERQKVLPVKGVRRQSISKETRIRGLVPRFEWGRIIIAPGQSDLRDEYALFPRAAHDDLLDALASIEDIVFYPTPVKEDDLNGPLNPSDPDYERKYIKRLAAGLSPRNHAAESDY